MIFKKEQSCQVLLVSKLKNLVMDQILILCDSSVTYGFFNISLLSIKNARPHTVEPTKIGKCLIYLFLMVGPKTKFQIQHAKKKIINSSEKKPVVVGLMIFLNRPNGKQHKKQAKTVGRVEPQQLPQASYYQPSPERRIRRGPNDCSAILYLVKVTAVFYSTVKFVICLLFA